LSQLAPPQTFSSERLVEQRFAENAVNAYINNPAIREAVQFEIKAAQKKKTRTAWYNPCTEWITDERTQRQIRPQTIYVGEDDHARPTWNSEDAVIDLPTYTHGMNIIRTARREGRSLTATERDQLQNNFYVSDYWRNLANEYKGLVRTGGVITSDDYSGITVLNVMAELLGTRYMQHTIVQAVTTVNTPSITLQIDTYSKFTASSNVDEGITVPTKKGGFSRQSVNLLKDVGHLAFSDEVLMRPYYHDIYQTQVENVVADLQRIKARKIAVNIELATNVTGTDWTTTTGNFSTNNPYNDIGGVGDTILLNGGIPDTIISADKPFRSFISNTWVKGAITAVPDNTFGARIIGNVPGLPTFTWYIDNEKSTTAVCEMDKKSVILAQGPVRTAQYRYEEAGVDGYITRDWNGVQTVQSGFIRNITGVNS